MKKVFLKGYLKHNLGDDLFIKMICERYNEKFFINNSINMKYDKMFDNLYSNKSVVKYIYYKLISKLKKKKNYLELRMINSCDYLVTIGGSIFIENTSNMYQQIYIMNEVYNTRPKKYILGSNFGPYIHYEFKNEIKNIFTKCEDVCFRDAFSYKLFEELSNVRVNPDIIFSLNIEKYVNVSLEKEKMVLFSIIDCKSRNNLKKYNEEYEKKIIELIRFFNNKNYKIVLMSFCKYEKDEIAIERLIKKCKLDKKIDCNIIDLFKYDRNIDDAMKLFAKCSIVVGTRFHANILGIRFGKKIIPISYSDKTINSLRDAGYTSNIYEIKKINDLIVNEDLLDNDYNVEINELSKKAELQFLKLDEIFEKK